METRTVVSEFVGTSLFVFFGVGSVVLAAEFIGTLGIALAFGFVLLALIYVLGPISGCHVNPAVTLGVLTAGRITPRQAGEYWAAQFVGAVVGSGVLYLVAQQVPGLSTEESFGTTGFAERSALGINIFGAFVTELVLTFLLVFMFLAASERIAVVGLAALPIGLTLAVTQLVGVPVTGASVNPVRSIGPALFAGGSALTQLWLFILAPLVGGALAALAHRYTQLRNEPLPSAAPVPPGRV